jgi:hypothetical protein
MSQNKSPNIRKENLVAWVGFKDNSANLRRVLAPNGSKGLFLRTADSDLAREIRQKALDFGFVELRTNGALHMMFADGKIPFSAKELANALGGHLIPLDRNDLLSDKWTLNLSDRNPKFKKQSVKKENRQPNPDQIRIIGLNTRGEEVVRDDTGRFFRKINQDDGRPGFVAEGGEDGHVLFLRAARKEDLEVIASSLVLMASRGTLHQTDFDRVIAAACEEGPHGSLGMSPEEAGKIVRQHMLREISAIAIDKNLSRDKFITALRISSSTGFVLSRPSSEDGQLSPSPAMIAFMRRAVAGSSAVDFRGTEDLMIAMPRIQRDDAKLQVHDLGDIPEDGVSSYVSNILARRPADGRTILRLPQDADHDLVQHLRSEVGISYALEVVANISAAVADGMQGGRVSTLMVIGERRPEPLDALPKAALRTFNVVTSDDLMNLEREIVRSRSRIRDFHQGVENAGIEAEDDREENLRQKPYQPLSTVKEPFTMIPVALEGATTKALERVRRDFDDRGGVDAVVASALGESLDTLGDILTAEQVDAVAMRLNANERGRGFLLADQTGVGKGRSLAAIARAHLRADKRNKVMYLTESAQINAPDVGRDLQDVGAWAENNTLFLTAGTVMTVTEVDPVTGEEITREVTSPKPARRKEIMESEAWPEDVDIIISTYSSFRGADDDVSSIWIENALDEHTMLIFDEAHNALNPRSRQGRNARKMIDQVGPSNVVFGTATPSRDPSGMNLYSALLPASSEEGLKTILDNMSSGGEVAQEAFATMLAEDGVMLRRDHDLSNIDFQVSLPDDDTIVHYQKVMNTFSPVVELMIEASSEIGAHLGRRQSLAYHEMIQNGLSRQAARAATNEMNQYSTALGSPLANLARITMNAVKVDQVVDAALQEIAEGRKPLITFHSTNAGLLNELARDETGAMSEEAMNNATDLTLRDQIRRIHNGMYRVKIDGEWSDARDVYPDIAQTYQMIEDHIDNIPDNLPVSPVDALVAKLEENGVSVGEISGRTLCYRDNRIQRRQGRDRRATIDSFNSGGLDVLIYNAAGATGGSYHSSPKFADQRPRTMIESEAPADVIKYVQSQGRGNRYGQVHNPRVVSVMTGLTPEMRILQQRNRKLRSLGASVDGNRSHPLLLDDVPDLLNKVGDEATRNVLISMPSLSRRLGFPEFAEDPQNNANADEVDTGSGGRSAIDSLSNKVLARSIMLSAREQDDLVTRIRMEFDALIEELESRNANPLRPKELEGQVDIRATSIYSGVETEDGDLDTSAFLSPLYISTGVHNFNEEAWTGDRLVTEVEACRRIYGADGFATYAERIRQNLPNLMRPFLLDGASMEECLANPVAGGPKFEVRHRRLTDLAWLLENMKPGVSMRFPTEFDADGMEIRTIVGLVAPSSKHFYDIPSAYKVKTISPGMSRPETTSLSRIIGINMERIFFHKGLSEHFEASYLENFDRDSLLTRRLPVQVLSGNILQAINEASRHNLGTVSLYRDADNHVHRGIVVNRSKINLDQLPVNISNPKVSAEFLYEFMTDEDFKNGETLIKLWGGVTPGKKIGDRNDSEIIITATPRSFKLDMIPFRKSSYQFYAERPGLYELMYGQPMPSRSEAPAKAYRRAGAKGDHVVRFFIDTPEAKRRAMNIVEALGTTLVTDGKFRSRVNDATIRVDNAGAEGLRRFEDEITIEAEAEEFEDIEMEEVTASDDEDHEYNPI